MTDPLAPPPLHANSTARWTTFLAIVDVCVWINAALFAWQGFHVLAVLFAYAALSLFAVTVLYARAVHGANPGPYLKGDRAPWLQLLFLPFRAVAWVVTILGRLWRWHHPPISEIAPGIYVGVRLFLPEARRLHALGVTCVLDLCAELPTNLLLSRAPFTRLQLPVLDRCPPSEAEIAHAADWVAERLREGNGVYIHCAFGRGRSAMMAAVVLLRTGVARDADEAMALLTRARSIVSVKGAQRAALERYARSLSETRAA